MIDTLVDIKVLVFEPEIPKLSALSEDLFKSKFKITVVYFGKNPCFYNLKMQKYNLDAE